MVRAKYYSSKRTSISRKHRRKKRKPSASSSHHGSSKNKFSSTASRPPSPHPRSRAGSRGQSRSSSIDSLYSRDSSYDRLTRPSKYNSDMTHSHSHSHRPPHYDRMVCEAVARLKSRKGSSTRELAKSLAHRYPEARSHGSKTIKRVIVAAKKLLREGRLVKDGSRFRLSKTSARSGKSDYDGFSEAGSYVLRDSKRSRKDRHRGRSLSRGRPRKSYGSLSQSRASSRSRSRSRKTSKKVHRTKSRRHRKGKKGKSRGSTRGAQGARRNIKRGAKRKKKGAQKGRTRITTGKRGPRQKKLSRARRRTKHSQNSRRAKSEKPEGDSNQNRGWFGGWFGGRAGGEGDGDSKPQNQNEQSSSSKSGRRPGSRPGRKSNKSQQRAITGGEPPQTEAV